MSTKRPKKRLVGSGEYLSTVVTRVFTYASASGCIAGGLVLLLVGGLLLLGAVCFAISGLIQDGSRLFHDISVAGTLVSTLLVGVLCAGVGGIGWCAFMIGVCCFRDARHAAPVGLLTKSSAKQLPEVETLVRGSERPASDPQVELLRATQQGSETPPEQLLRATQENT